MSWIERCLQLQTRRERALFEKSAAAPAQAQEQLILRLVRKHQRTVFGQAHGFEQIRGPLDYQHAVPIRDYEKLRPYLQRLLAGERNILTVEPPIMFATTSGTSGDPKFIPVTAAWQKELTALSRLWMAYAASHHPSCFAGRALFVASPPIEGFTSSGLPYGSMSGVSSRRVPWTVRRQFAIPEVVNLIADPEARYFLTMRIALARNVTVVATPNATTLLRLAEIADSRSEEIIKAVHDGTLGIPAPALVPAASLKSGKELSRWCRARPSRARELAGVRNQRGRLCPSYCWPQLRLIGCWLGGTAGLHARKLEAWYGSAPLRDLGLVASEGRMTIPTEDSTAAGCLAVHRSYFEFIPEDRLDEENPPVYLAHQLELGKRYNLAITGGNGLWRYDMNDLVEVRGFFQRTPKVAFVRKGGDVLSLTGEKVHLDQIQTAIREAERATGLEAWQFRLVGDAETTRHDLLIEFRDRAPSNHLPTFLRRFDAALARLNCEYASKRKSKRLAPPRLWVMKPGWSERQCREDFGRGKREHQYKWPAIREAWDHSSRKEVVASVELSAEEQCRTV